MSPALATYDYTVITDNGGEAGMEIAVVAFVRELAESYVAAFAASGVALLSLELEAHSIARAISDPLDKKGVALLVDFGRARTGFAVLKHGIPIFTSTVEVGDDLINKTLEGKFGLSGEDAIFFKNEEGLRAPVKKDSPGPEAVVGAASALGDEIVRHFHYWETRRTERGEHVDQIDRVMLVGGGANLRGLADYIAHRIHLPVVRGDVWRNISSFEVYIPPIDRRTSLQYATAAGLALRNE